MGIPGLEESYYSHICMIYYSLPYIDEYRWVHTNWAVVQADKRLTSQLNALCAAKSE